MILLSNSDQVNIEETSPKVIESTGDKDKDSTTSVDNMLHGFLGRIGGKIQWCIILLIILVLVYISHPTLLKFSQRKTPNSADQTNNSLINSLTSTAASPPTSLTNSHFPQNGLDNPTPTPEQPSVLPLLLASFLLHDASASQGKPGVVIPIIISSQNGQIPCSILIDTVSPVTLLREKLQCQLNLPATPLDSHYYLVRALWPHWELLWLIQCQTTKYGLLQQLLCHHWHTHSSQLPKVSQIKILTLKRTTSKLNL